MITSIIIGWAAELTAVHLSAGIALAVLAWLQCSPEFAVEAAIAWSQNSELALANLTGSLRLLMGLGWPMVFFIHWIGQARKKKRAKDVTLEKHFAVEAAGLGIPVLYFLVIWAKGTWTTIDGIILVSFYGLYFWMLNRERKYGEKMEEELDEDDEEAWVVRKVLAMKPATQKIITFSMFLFGGIVLYFTVHPFVESLKAAAFAFGVTEFVFIQWVAPIASEFPEKVTAFNWARDPKKVSMAVVNMLSSVTSQWTLLAGLVPIVFSISAGHMVTLELTPFQRTEVLLTIVQSAVAVIFLADLKIKDHEAAGLFILWLAQFLMPSSRGPLVLVYVLWFAVEAIRLAMAPQELTAWKALQKIIFPTKHQRRGAAS